MSGVLIHGPRDPIAPYDGGAMRWWARRFFRVGGVSLSAPQTAAYFAARNAIPQPPTETNLPAGNTRPQASGLRAGRTPCGTRRKR